MIYEYTCESCNLSIDIVKPVSEYDRVENCAACAKMMSRVFSPKIHLHNTAVQEKEYNPAFGKAVSRSEAKRLAKLKGMVEVGNERPEKHLKPKHHDYDI